MPSKQPRVKPGKIQGTRVTYNKSGAKFEILCNPDVLAKVDSWDGSVPLAEIVLGEPVVYRERGLKNGDKATRAELEAAFGTDETSDCITAILQNKFKPKPSKKATLQTKAISLDLDELPEAAKDRRGPFGLPSYFKRGLSEEASLAASLAWIGCVSDWSTYESDESEQRRRFQHRVERKIALLIAEWLDKALRMSVDSLPIETMALRIFAQCGGASYYADDSEIEAECRNVLKPLQRVVKELIAEEEVKILDYAKNNELARQLQDVTDSHSPSGRGLTSGRGGRPSGRGRRRARTIPLVTQQPFLAFMDPDLYVLIDHYTASQGFVFTETFYVCALALMALFLDPSFSNQCKQIAAAEASSSDYQRKLEPKSTWLIHTTPRDKHEGDDDSDEDIREDFLEWRVGKEYESDEEPNEELQQSWRKQAKYGLVSDAHVIDALRGCIVSTNAEEQLMAYERVRSAFPNVIRTRNDFVQTSSEATRRLSPCVSMNVIVEPGMTFSEMLDSPEFLGVVTTIKQLPHPDEDDEDFDMTVQVLRALLPHIGDRKVAMVAEVQLLLKYYAQAEDARPHLWSLINEAEGLLQLSRSCEVRLGELERSGRCDDGVWSENLVLTLRSTMEADSLRLAAVDISGDEKGVVHVKEPKVSLWADVEPMLLKAVRRRDAVVQFLLPDGRQVSQDFECQHITEFLIDENSGTGGYPA